MPLEYILGYLTAKYDSNGSHGKSSSPEYAVWKSMINRCINKSNNNYKNYGGKGVTVSSEWRNFETFSKDMGKRPAGATLDRINPKKGYSKGNCRWAEAGDAGARTNDVYIKVGGKKKRLKEVAAAKGLKEDTLRKRVNRGMDLKKAVTKKA
jgi:hypothetical protein